MSDVAIRMEVMGQWKSDKQWLVKLRQELKKIETAGVGPGPDDEMIRHLILWGTKRLEKRK